MAASPPPAAAISRLKRVVVKLGTGVLTSIPAPPRAAPENGRYPSTSVASATSARRSPRCAGAAPR